MLESLSSLAIVPKAKAIGARRLTHEDYRTLMRKRSVMEVVASLQTHPYFKRSLAGLSPVNSHRQQIEEALSKDIFYKYESLMRYCMRENHFGSFFLTQCEVHEILTKLQCISMGVSQQYISQLPGFLASKTSFSLIALAKADSASACIKVLSGTPYAKVLAKLVPTDTSKLDYLACEQAFLTYYYTDTLAKIDRDVTGTLRKTLRQLFETEAELHNLDVLLRAKAFFADALPPQKLETLLLPFHRVLTPKVLRTMAYAADLDAFMLAYNASRAKAAYGAQTAGVTSATSTQQQRVMLHSAEKLLHFSSKPESALAALLCLAQLEVNNLTNIIEGVRYQLAPEQIEAFIKC